MRTEAIDKSDEFRREFHELPNVLIQDPIRACAYFIPADSLKSFEANVDTWAKVDDTTVTFVIPDGSLVDEVPPYLRAPELRPSFLIRYARGRSAYFLTFDDVQAFRVEQPRTALGPNSISFIVPKGTELIEELPSLRRALLQSNTQ